MSEIKEKDTVLISTSQNWHGIDRHIFAMLLHRFWAVIAGGVTVLMIPVFLDPMQQGYYFTFASILALQIFFELGIGQVIVQIVAHEAAHLQKNLEDELYVGDQENIARLHLLQRLLHRWYVPSAWLFWVVVTVAGFIFFWNGGLEFTEWAPAWLFLVSITAINFYLSWRISFVEGFGLIKDISLLRLRQSVIGYLLLWCGLFFWSELWVVVAVPLTSTILTIIWLRSKNIGPIFTFKTDQPALNPIDWRRDIFPFQWRIAISWISGYFIFQLFTPLTFQRVGAEEAGRLGLAITIFSAIGTIGLSWVNAKAPSLSMMISRNESRHLIVLLKNSIARSLIFTILLCFGFLAAVWIAIQMDVKIIERIAEFPILLCLAVVTIINCIIFSAAIFMRAHKEEPMLGVSVISGILIAIVAWVGSNYGALEIIVGYAAVTLLISLPWTFFILLNYINRHKIYE